MRNCLTLLLVLGLLSCQGAPPPDDTSKQETPPPKVGLEGAWKVTETSLDTNPQPGLYIFTKKHYSIMFVPSGTDGSQPRKLFAGDVPVIGTTNPTDAEKVAAYDSLIANSGTYELSDSKVMTKCVVAKNPNFAVSGEIVEYSYQLDGDTLKLTMHPPFATDSETVTTLVRLE